ncbi:XkdW family protein [Aquitalea aquatica]|uniref:DUF4376 domain-containing protein n=1 Tax=Aquitalea aquatica TaxID=3044273 RepID=A0A838YEV1_9NEIS|nr:XkdW family protein [Aquitalea magnusonii]MBA4709595.1 DUF4376 domain-containing protein [Aquitalea magnusonii]
MALIDGLKYLFPAAVPGVDYVLQNDGEGDYIKAWNLTATQPSAAAISTAETAALLSTARATQLSALAAAFATASTADVTDSAGLTWTGGFDSAQKIYGAAQLAQAAGAASVTIFDASNAGHSLTIAQATAAAAAVGAAYQAVFAKYQGLKVQIASATTIKAVQAITW